MWSKSFSHAKSKIITPNSILDVKQYGQNIYATTLYILVRYILHQEFLLLGVYKNEF